MSFNKSTKYIHMSDQYFCPNCEKITERLPHEAINTETICIECNDTYYIEDSLFRQRTSRNIKQQQANYLNSKDYLQMKKLKQKAIEMRVLNKGLVSN